MPTPKLSWRSLSLQMIFLTILPLTALVLVVAFGSLTIHQRAMRTLVGERDERSVRTAAAALDEQISHRNFGIRSLAFLADQVSNGDLESLMASHEYLLPEFDGGLAIFNSNGKLETTSTGSVIWENLTSQVSTLINDNVIGQDNPFLYEVFMPGTPGIPIVLVLITSPSHKWIAGGAFTADEMFNHTLATSFDNGTGASILVIDREGRLLYKNGGFSYSGKLNNHPGVAQALNGQSGTQYMMVGSEEYVIAYSPISTLGWALILEEPWAMVESPILRSSQMAPLILAPVLILAIVALWFTSRQIIKPLQNLESRASMLAWNKFDPIEEPVGGIEEIRQLQKSLIHMAHKVRSAQTSLHGYIRAITTAQEDERKRLARELHDDTIQAMIALKQQVQLTQLSQPKPIGDSLEGIVLLIEQAIENLRRLTRALRPIYLEDLGLVPALEMLARETSMASGIPIQFKRWGEEMRLEPSTELALYRMAQEALSNVTRHSQATQSTVSIYFNANHVTVQVDDNGIGFDVPKNPADFAPGGHFGLLGLYERADLIGAALEINSIKGKGTQVKVILPIGSTE